MIVLPVPRAILFFDTKDFWTVAHRCLLFYREQAIMPLSHRMIASYDLQCTRLSENAYRGNEPRHVFERAQLMLTQIATKEQRISNRAKHTRCCRKSSIHHTRLGVPHHRVSQTTNTGLGPHTPVLLAPAQSLAGHTFAFVPVHQLWSGDCQPLGGAQCAFDI